jgi:5-methylcytosine-specific restriction endonuclease McrA
MTKRLASRGQRYILWVMQDGKCAICRGELPDVFETDHLVRYADGGGTELFNLQALCVACHQTKTRGDSMKHTHT